jgi:hypothetical protein
VIGEPPALRLFLDRSTQGKRFTGAVRRLVQDVETIDDRYGREAVDPGPWVYWIAAHGIDRLALDRGER